MTTLLEMPWTRYQGTNAMTEWGAGLDASGPYVVVGNMNVWNHGWWLYKRENGVLVEKIYNYTPTIYVPTWGGAYYGCRVGCYYRKEFDELLIIVGAVHDGADTHGRVYFYSYTDSGGVVERGYFEPATVSGARLGRAVAIGDGYAMASAQTDSGYIAFFSESSRNVWQLDAYDAYPGANDASTYGMGELSIWKHGPTSFGIIGRPVGNVGATLLKLNDRSVLFNKTGIGGNAVAVGPGRDGNGTAIMGNNIIYDRGIYIIDRIDDDTWEERGFIDSYPDNATMQYASAVGYNCILWGWQLNIGGKVVGVVDIVQTENGDWPLSGNPPTGTPQWYTYPKKDPLHDPDNGTTDRAISISYQDGGLVRFVVGGRWYPGNGIGSIVEYQAELDFPYPPAIDDVDPDVIPDNGGVIMTITGDFPAETALRVHLGPLGTQDDPQCYGGEGYGYWPQSLDGETLVVISPPVEAGTCLISVWEGSSGLGSLPITVVEANWPLKFYEIRRAIPPWTEVGVRRLREEN